VAALHRLLVGQSDHRDLGIGEHGARDQSVIYFVMLASERVERRDLAFLGAHRRRSAKHMLRISNSGR